MMQMSIDEGELRFNVTGNAIMGAQNYVTSDGVTFNIYFNNYQFVSATQTGRHTEKSVGWRFEKGEIIDNSLYDRIDAVKQIRRMKVDQDYEIDVKIIRKLTKNDEYDYGGEYGIFVRKEKGKRYAYRFDYEHGILLKETLDGLGSVYFLCAIHRRKLIYVIHENKKPFKCELEDAFFVNENVTPIAIDDDSPFIFFRKQTTNSRYTSSRILVLDTRTGEFHSFEMITEKGPLITDKVLGVAHGKIYAQDMEGTYSQSRGYLCNIYSAELPDKFIVRGDDWKSSGKKATSQMKAGNTTVTTPDLTKRVAEIEKAIEQKHLATVARLAEQNRAQLAKNAAMEVRIAELERKYERMLLMMGRNQ